jgi:hypothetical protein
MPERSTKSGARSQEGIPTTVEESFAKSPKISEHHPPEFPRTAALARPNVSPQPFLQFSLVFLRERIIFTFAFASFFLFLGIRIIIFALCAFAALLTGRRPVPAAKSPPAAPASWFTAAPRIGISSPCRVTSLAHRTLRSEQMQITIQSPQSCPTE